MMRCVTRLTLKERLGERLAEYPLLRTMLLNPWFALAFLGMSLAALTIVVSLPRVWASTPKGFTPEIKVSLLDLAQARMLRSSAERKARQGDYAGAISAWSSALGNDPGSLDLFRGAFRCLGEGPELPQRTVGRLLNGASWMVQLGGTNRTDLGLIAGAFDKYGLAEEVYLLLNPLAEGLEPSLEAAYLKALFSVARYREFGARWETVEHRLPDDPALGLYRTAYLAGWGPPGGTEAHLQKLRAAMDDLHLGSVACRLLMAVSRERLDAETFALALEREVEASRDRIADHTEYWRLLRTLGRTELARRLAIEFGRPPRAPSEVVVTAQTLMQLELSDEALAYLRRHAIGFGAADDRWSAAVWEVYGDLLIQRRDWEGLKDVATQMRSLPGSHLSLAGFARFLEGRAAYATGAIPAAEAAFEEAIAAGFPLGRLGIRVSLSLLQMSYYDQAVRVLLPLERDFQRDLQYWETVFDAAYYARQDETLLLKAAKAAHDLDPSSEKWRFNYAAALVIGQWRPEEALRLTWTFLQEHPDMLPAQINHIVALAVIGRAEDAAGLLERIDPNRLSGLELGMYHLASVGVYGALRDWDRVRMDLPFLQSERLFPTQQRWVDGIRRAMPASPVETGQPLTSASDRP